MAKPKRPRDANHLAKLIGDIATGQVKDENPDEGKSPKRVAASSKGGKARAKKLTPKKRKDIAKKAAKSRWNQK